MIKAVNVVWTSYLFLALTISFAVVSATALPNNDNIHLIEAFLRKRFSTTRLSDESKDSTTVEPTRFIDIRRSATIETTRLPDERVFAAATTPNYYNPRSYYNDHSRFRMENETINSLWPTSPPPEMLSIFNNENATAAVKTIHKIQYKIDHVLKKIDVLSIDGDSCDIKTVAPGGRFDNRNERYETMHHFPGVASDVVLRGAQSADEHLRVLLNDGVLLRVVPNRTYFNFHTHKQRMIYGQLRSFTVDDFAIADQIYTGAPIFSQSGELVSVVSCRFDEYDDGVAVYPVTGVRSPTLASGHIVFDDEVYVHELDPANSVYGRRQLPYGGGSSSVTETDNSRMNIKKMALAVVENKRMYRNWPRSVVVFHNKRDVSIGLVEGYFEIMRIRLDGPMVVPQHK
nr:p26 [Calliteara abietis nucleopolyhedrovirus]